MLNLFKTVVYANIAVQRRCLKFMGEAVKSGEEIVNSKEAFLEEFFPRAQASGKKIENLIHNTVYMLAGKIKPSFVKKT